MKIAQTTLVTVFLSKLDATKLNWQEVGFCGIPVNSFDESIITNAQTRSGRGLSSVVEQVGENEVKRNACRNKAVKDWEDSQKRLADSSGSNQSGLGLDLESPNGLRGRGLSVDDEHMSDYEYYRVLQRVNHACNDVEDRGYEHKKLDPEGHPSLYQSLKDLNSTAYSAFDSNPDRATRATRETLDAIFRREVKDFFEKLKANHKRCYKAYVRLAENAEAKQLESIPYKRPHPDNIQQVWLLIMARATCVAWGVAGRIQ